MIKQGTYHAFAGDFYYPMQGIGDYVGGFQELHDATDAAWRHGHPDWVVVLTENENRQLVEVYNEHRED